MTSSATNDVSFERSGSQISEGWAVCDQEVYFSVADTSIDATSIMAALNLGNIQGNSKISHICYKNYKCGRSNGPNYVLNQKLRLKLYEIPTFAPRKSCTRPCDLCVGQKPERITTSRANTYTRRRDVGIWRRQEHHTPLERHRGEEGRSLIGKLQ